MPNPLSILRHIARLEGVSFLVLLGIAMPLKHFAGVPRVVAVAGWIHGVLFIALFAALLCAMLLARLSLGRAAAVFAASLLPFGPFVLDRRLAGWEAQRRRGRPGEPGAASPNS